MNVSSFAAACRKSMATVFAMAMIVVARGEGGAAADIEPREAEQIAVEAYHYLYPLVIMDVSRRQMTNIEPGKMIGRGPMNTFSHMRAFPPADFREVVRPNFDTLYSSAWLDLTDGPVVVSTPDTGDRYYLLPMLDMWTDVFASPGKRTTGTTPADFAVVPPRWEGTLPSGMARIESPTPFVWIIGRTQTNGAKDYDAVHRVQDGYRLTPLRSWGMPAQPRSVSIDPVIDMTTPPLVQVATMTGKEFFELAARLLEQNAPHLTDQPVIARMRRLGIVPTKPFRADEAAPVVRQAIDKAPEVGLEQMRAALPRIAKVVNTWQMNTETIGVYGNAYLKRAVIAMAGLGANVPEDAIYPINLGDADGQPLDGKHRYVIRFEKNQLPPVDAFWSVTPYDADGFPVANAINRLAIGDRDALVTNADGSLELFLQHASPGAAREPNWLPVPKGGFNLTMRLYSPRAAAIDGAWSPPPVRREQE